MPRERISFEINVPQPIVLAFDEGRDVAGRYGDQVYYSLEGERCMYVEPIVRTQFQKLGVKRGEEIFVCKRQVKIGNRSRIDWQVWRAGEPATEAVSNATSAAESNGNHRKAAPSAPHPITTPRPAPGSPPCSPVIDQLVECLTEAMAASMRAEKAAQSIGCNVRFNSEDVRAMGISLFIERQKRGAR